MISDERSQESTAAQTPLEGVLLGGALAEEASEEVLAAQVGERPGAEHGVAHDELLHGPVMRALLRLAWPTTTTAALQGLVAAVDVIMVGRLGGASVATVTACRQTLMVVQVGGSAVAAGCAALVAQAVGRGDRKEADHVLTQSMLLFAAVILFVLMPLGWFSAPWILRRLSSDPEVFRLGLPFLRVLTCSQFFTLTGFAANGALRGAGDVKTPLKIITWANTIHVILNYALIFGVVRLGIPACGVMGAAFGTVLARGATSLWLFWLLGSGRLALRLRWRSARRVDLGILRRVLRIGIPTSVSAVLLNLYGLLVISILGRTPAGTAAVAAYGLSSILRNLGTWTTWGLGEATMAMVGQNIGARQLDRAAQAAGISWRVGAGFLLAVAAVCAAASPWLLALLLREPDPVRKAAVVAIGVGFLVSQVVALPFTGVGMCLRGALAGAGDTVTPLVIDLLCHLLLGLPLCAWLALDRVSLWWTSLPGCGWGPWGVWAGMAAAAGLRGMLTLVYWRSGRWRTKRA